MTVARNRSRERRNARWKNHCTPESGLSHCLMIGDDWPLLTVSAMRGPITGRMPLCQPGGSDMLHGAGSKLERGWTAHPLHDHIDRGHMAVWDKRLCPRQAGQLGSKRSEKGSTFTPSTVVVPTGARVEGAYAGRVNGHGQVAPALVRSFSR